MQRKRFQLLYALVALVCLISISRADASSYKVLHRFHRFDGAFPNGALVMDPAGNLYGITQRGGNFDHGTVFRLTRNSDGTWSESVLHSFAGEPDGSDPLAGLIFDSAGNLYGTTHAGGDSTACPGGGGTVFTLTPGPDGSWTESVIHRFSGSDGCGPERSGVIIDAAGNLYGTAAFGGSGSSGVVFKLTPEAGGWTPSVLYNFTGGLDGQSPASGVVLDAAGNLYGTTLVAGAHGRGTIFKIAPGPDGSWSETTLHSFSSGGKDGFNPNGLTIDANGTLFGTTFNGGGSGLSMGMVFRLKPNPDGSWTYRKIHTFIGEPGSQPIADLTLYDTGLLYGTTFMGGLPQSGVMFKLAHNPNDSWSYTVAHVFLGRPGRNPEGRLIRNKTGKLYGTTTFSDFDGILGVVFEFTP